MLQVKFRYTRQYVNGEYRVYYIRHKFTQTTSILLHDYFQRNTFSFTVLQNHIELSVGTVQQVIWNFECCMRYTVVL